jgi:hypothetical protein
VNVARRAQSLPLRCVEAHSLAGHERPQPLGLTFAAIHRLRVHPQRERRVRVPDLPHDAAAAIALDAAVARAAT